MSFTDTIIIETRDFPVQKVHKIDVSNASWGSVDKGIKDLKEFADGIKQTMENLKYLAIEDVLKWAPNTDSIMHSFLEGENAKMDSSGKNFYISWSENPKCGLVIKDLFLGININAEFGDLIVKFSDGTYTVVKPKNANYLEISKLSWKIS